MNHIDSIRISKAFLETSGFVVLPRADYDKDQNAFIALDDELKAAHEQLQKWQVQLTPKEKRHPEGHWEKVYPHRAQIDSLEVGQCASWTAKDEQESSLLHSAILHWTGARQRTSRDPGDTKTFRTRRLRALIETTRRT